MTKNKKLLVSLLVLNSASAFAAVHESDALDKTAVTDEAISPQHETHTTNIVEVADEVIAKQRAELAKNTVEQGYGPQSPRDIDNLGGLNDRIFGKAPHYSKMNLCNIHFHLNAEHKGGEFTTFAGNGNGKGHGTGYRYSGKLTESELKPYQAKNDLNMKSGDTIELHYVFSTAQVNPGATLGACVHPSIGNPQLRVEAQVFVLVNDDKALDFQELTAHSKLNGYTQALNIPKNTGRPIVYAGSTTGADYNEKGSPFQVTWSVRPRVAKVNIESVDKWLNNNAFNETRSHGVRNLVVNPALLSSGHK